jgi:hypothetical protein
VNAVKLADENQSDGFVDQGAAVLVDGDGVLEVRDAPGFCEERRGEGEDSEKEYEGRMKGATTGAKARIDFGGFTRR